MNNSVIEGNDSVWLSRFQWTNLDQVAKRVEVDVCFSEISGYTYSYFNAFLENGFLITIGLRQTNVGEKKASMSVIRHRSETNPRDIDIISGEAFQARKGREDDVYCIGNFWFDLDEYIRLISVAIEDRVEGYLLRWRNKELVKIGTFFTGSGSNILPDSSNGVALERVGMKNACETKSHIFIRNPLRIGVDDSRGGVTRGMISYQRCPNVNVESLPDEQVSLSHGGDTIKRTPSGWIDWAASEPIDFNVYDFLEA